MTVPRPSKFVATAVVIAAALAMTATLPGRTHGLGLATTRLLSDFPQIDATAFARINLAATLIGSLFCLPCGWLIDRLGVRPVLTVVLLALAATVVLMSRAVGTWWLAACITLSRGLGQSMLSVLSITMLGKWFRRDAGLVMGAYAVLMTIFMAAATGGLAVRVTAVGWRAAWLEMGFALALITPLACWLAFPARRSGDEPRVDRAFASAIGSDSSATLRDALASGCFWIFASSISLFGLATAGVSLFQQLILAERGLSESVFHVVLIIGLLAGLAANLIGGWLLRRCSMATLLAIAMFLLAGSLAALPFLRTSGQAYVQGVVAGVAGGLLTVLFFAVWAPAFGPQHLGRIQSSAQMMTVLASAVGPLFVAWGREHFGSYLPVLSALAIVSAAFGCAALRVSIPSAGRGDWSVGRSQPAIASG